MPEDVDRTLYPRGVGAEGKGGGEGGTKHSAKGHQRTQGKSPMRELMAKGVVRRMRDLNPQEVLGMKDCPAHSFPQP
jgi:hypothetical protein